MNPELLLATLTELYADTLDGPCVDDVVEWVLTDLRHLCDKEGRDFAVLNKRAAQVYNEELG